LGQRVEIVSGDELLKVVEKRADIKARADL
jgi:hypothetical protein